MSGFKETADEAEKQNTCLATRKILPEPRSYRTPWDICVSNCTKDDEIVKRMKTGVIANDGFLVNIG